MGFEVKDVPGFVPQNSPKFAELQEKIDKYKELARAVKEFQVACVPGAADLTERSSKREKMFNALKRLERDWET